MTSHENYECQSARKRDPHKGVFFHAETHYGAPRVRAALRAGEETHGRKRIARLMREARIVGIGRRCGTVTTTRRDKEARPAPDLVDRNFTGGGPKPVLGRRYYVHPDRCRLPVSGRCLGCVWPPDRRLVDGEPSADGTRAGRLGMAVGQQRPPDVIHHSDQGSQPNTPH